MSINTGAAAASSRRRSPGVRDVAPAPLVEVMLEQLKYLIAHAAGNCPPGCEDCARFAQVKEILLQPFQSQKIKQRKAAGAAAGSKSHTTPHSKP